MTIKETDDEILIEEDSVKADTEYCAVCGKEAQWCFMPDGICYCDEHVPRGCSCNVDNLIEFGEPDRKDNLMWWTEEEMKNEPMKGTLERKEDSVYYEYLDEQGRRSPCCEFMWIG